MKTALDQLAAAASVIVVVVIVLGCAGYGQDRPRAAARRQLEARQEHQPGRYRHFLRSSNANPFLLGDTPEMVDLLQSYEVNDHQDGIRLMLRLKRAWYVESGTEVEIAARSGSKDQVRPVGGGRAGWVYGWLLAKEKVDPQLDRPSK